MNTHGAYMTMDLSNYAYNSGGNDYVPSSVLDILKGVVPRISTLMSTVRHNYNMYPSYLVTGLKTASLLRSLQQYMVSFPGVKGESGFTGDQAQFTKLKILEAKSIGDTKMYMTTKAPQNALEKSSIIDLIYQPLYIVKEITDGNSRNYIRSRTMLEIARTDGLACLTVNNIGDYVG